MNKNLIFDDLLLETKISDKFLSETNFNKNEFLNYILLCNNEYGGFGQIPGSESHVAHTFCCVSILKSLGQLESYNKNATIDFCIGIIHFGRLLL